MSRVMKALELSEQNYRAASFSPSNSMAQVQVREEKTSKWLVVGLIIVPALLVGAIRSYQLFEEKLLAWQTSSQQEPIVLEVPFSYEVVPYPVFSQLQATYELLAPVYNEPPAAAEPVARKPAPKKKTVEQDPLLGDLDLSQLSPELALHVQSVLGGENPSSKDTAPVKVSNLSTHADRWYGKLPAMNFETHVYSSNPAKRWVKINGHEYKEGDWVTSAIKLDKIEQHNCLISFSGEKIEVPALYDWKG